ncbi:hypothetical protein J5N97_015097 [Dioscorea zingiberensis]|uniref:BHLH domain-containing protein n=1 Tax=Dioscorea zingiberensis TaxID=325984 RepID=A0A9D5HKD3_9LILI|nr:hypothetical protein J5N97_015097 [Dioscorea zingiberensis]
MTKPLTTLTTLILVPVLVLLLSCQPPTSISSPLPLLSPISKDPTTLHYTTPIHLPPCPNPIHLLFHLGSHSSWLHCPSNHSFTSTLTPLPCPSSLCFSCSHNTCSLLSENPLSHHSTHTPALQTTLSLPSTTGHHPGPFIPLPHHLFSCSPSSLHKGLPKSSSGLLSLGLSNSSFPSQLSSSLSLPNTLSFCLSGSPSAPGVAFFGSPGPFFFLPLPNLDISSSLSYTPLLPFPDSLHNTEYYINVTAIRVNGNPLPLNPSLFSGGTKLSTVQPYTTMQTSIYSAFVKAFMDEAAKMNLRLTAPVKPFTVCYSAHDVRASFTGPIVPEVDLVLHGDDDDVVWRMFGVNSMVWMEMGASMCLAFIDGGHKLGGGAASIVVGGHQMEDVLVQLDLEGMKLGFSSSLLANGTSCSNFNFTASKSLEERGVRVCETVSTEEKAIRAFIHCSHLSLYSISNPHLSAMRPEFSCKSGPKRRMLNALGDAEGGVGSETPTTLKRFIYKKVHRQEISSTHISPRPLRLIPREVKPVDMGTGRKTEAASNFSKKSIVSMEGCSLSSIGGKSLSMSKNDENGILALVPIEEKPGGQKYDSDESGSEVNTPSKETKARAAIRDKLRRSKINEGIKALENSMPVSEKRSRESVLDDVIDYIKFLKLQLKLLSQNRLGGEATSFPFVQLEGYGHYLLHPQMSNEPLEEVMGQMLELNIQAANELLESKGLTILPWDMAYALLSTM